MPSKRDILWLKAPPALTASFSIIRIPGVVFLVSVRRTSNFPMASTKVRVNVAIPERCLIKFKATRSALSMFMISPLTLSTVSPFDTESPSLNRASKDRSESSVLNTFSATSSPAIIIGCFAMIMPFPLRFGVKMLWAVKSPNPESSRKASDINCVK